MIRGEADERRVSDHDIERAHQILSFACDQYVWVRSLEEAHSGLIPLERRVSWLVGHQGVGKDQQMMFGLLEQEADRQDIRLERGSEAGRDLHF